MTTTLGQLACPTGCGRTCKRGHLMCGPCWRRVPKDLQSEVYATWRSVQRGSATAYPAYERAREAAIASVP